jgi:hypothetical protein
LVILETLTGQRPSSEGRAATKAHRLIDTTELSPELRQLLAAGLSEAPERRPTAGELARRLRAALRSGIDDVQPDALLIGASAAWFRPPHGPRVDLSRRRTLRLILDALAQHHQKGSGAGLSLDDLISAGWPDEHILPEAALNRAHVALSTLRKLGLRDILESRDDGYHLAASVPVVMA